MSEPQKPKGEVIEGIAFQFCKIATVALILQRWTLPVAAFAASLLYLWAHFSGKRDTRCILRYPLLIGVFWGAVGGITLWLMLKR